MKNLEKVIKEYFSINEDDNNNGMVSIFYTDLDLDARAKILKAIDSSDKYVDVFKTEGAKEEIEKKLAQKPLLTIRGNELIKIMNIDF